MTGFNPRTDDMDLEKKCPKCGTWGNIEEVFGFRTINQKRFVQSWCRVCRNRGGSSSKKLTTDQTATTQLFCSIFSGDKAAKEGKRCWSFMAKRLIAKLGSDLIVTPEAKKLLQQKSFFA